jgi:DNA invertase Pin-like site-specific DNA recombinase
MRLRNLNLFKILKDIGSAFSKPQTDFKNLIRSCKNKIILVYEPSRLTRSFDNYEEIFKICKKNKHSIGFVNTGIIYDCYNDSDSYSKILPFIVKARQESIDLGDKISRSLRLKKLNELEWGKMKNLDGSIKNNIMEINISKLINLLYTKGSYINEIKSLIRMLGNTEGKEEFEIIEIINGKEYPMNLQNLPYPMSIKNITDTLNVYEIPRRKYKWSNNHVKSILENKNSFIYEDELCEEFEFIGVNRNIPIVKENKEVEIYKEVNWISFWYNPVTRSIPPNVEIPDGMNFPSQATLIYLPLKKTN